jgi:uncharacterized membrane protein
MGRTTDRSSAIALALVGLELDLARIAARIRDLQTETTAVVPVLPRPTLRDRVLRFLVRRGGAGTQSEVWQSLGCSRLEATHALQALERRGLVTFTDEVGARISGRGRAPRTYRVTPDGRRTKRVA